MSTRKSKAPESAERLDQAEDVAASIDAPATEAVKKEARAGVEADEAVDQALEAAAMVAEGGAVAAAATDDAPSAASMNGDRPGETDTATEPETVAAGAGSEAEAEPLVDVPSPAAEWGPVSDPPEPGPGNPSPDGQTLAFLQADQSGDIRLWLYALDASGGWSMGLPFIAEVEEDGPQWSPDGQWIALTGRRYRGGPTSIWLAPADGGDCVLLANHDASDRQPRWSPDGSLVAFVSRRDGRDTICVALPTGDGPVIQLTYGRAGEDDREPCWSDDSTRIAFLRRIVEADTQGDQVWTVSIATGETKQVTKKVANRHGLQWNPGKAQIGFVTDEGEWHNIGVVNPDNSAGWNLASEAGDKNEPRYSSDGGRLLYTRGLKGEVRLGERATSGATAELIDPGMGIASAPRWLPGKRVVYRFAPSTGSPHFIVQETKKDAERTILPAAVEWRADRPLIMPAFVEYETSKGAKLGGLYYRDPAAVGLTPVVIVLGDAPYARQDATFRPVEQALAAAGFGVFAPILPGSPGLGKKIQNDLQGETAEAETLTLLETITAVREFEAVDGHSIAIVGWGYGGALALVLAGARPGSVQAVVAIDPVCDWDDEFDQSTRDWREWQVRNFGLPTLSRGKHALRTPATFIGVADSPLLLIGTDRATDGRASQLASLLAIMQELETPHTHESAGKESLWETGERAARFIRETFGPNRAPAPEPTPEPESEEPAPDTERAEDI